MIGRIQAYQRRIARDIADVKGKNGRKFISPKMIAKFSKFSESRVSCLRKLRFLLQKARPGANPRRLSHFSWKSVKWFGLGSVGEKKRNPIGMNEVSALYSVTTFTLLFWHVTGHFGDESFQAITCTGTDNTKQTRENTPRTRKETTEQTNWPYISKNTQKRL